MDATEKKLIDFISRMQQLPGAPLSVFELVHVTDGENGTPVEPFGSAPPYPDPGLLAQNILRAAGEHCEAFSMPQRYAILAYREGGKGFSAQMALLLRPPTNTSNSMGGVTEPPTDRGIISQMMRHTEAAYGSMIQLAQTVATMHEARGNTAERYFNSFMAERERWTGFQAEREDRAAMRQEAEREAEHERYLERTAVEELRPIVRQIGPHMARKLADKVGLTDAGQTPPSAPKAAAPKAPGNNEENAADDQKDQKDQNEKQGEPIDAKQVLRDALNEITPEEADKLEEILGKDKVHRIINAALKATV